MDSIDLDALLAPISPDTPCGPDLEYDDPDFGEVERASEGKPEQQFGDTIIPAEEPDWPFIVRKASGLFARGKDLRIALHLTRALANTRGWRGFGDGLALIQGLVERYWETVHPQLDPDDGNDPTLRINALAMLNNADAMLDTLKSAPLVRVQGIGAFSWRDIQIAYRELPAPANAETAIPEPQLIEAAFEQVELEQLQDTHAAIEQARQLTHTLDEQLRERVGIAAAADFSALLALLDSAIELVAAPLARRTGGPVAGAPPSGESAAAGVTGAQSGAQPQSPGSITNSTDVVRTLDLLIEYYRRQEPSSPIPLLLTRARKLVNKNFFEIIEDLAPDGLSQVEVIRGREPESED